MDDIVRFGVSMDSGLLKQFDKCIKNERGIEITLKTLEVRSKMLDTGSKKLKAKSCLRQLPEDYPEVAHRSPASGGIR